MSEGINVLSLCDGMSCGHLALDRAGVKVNKYYASEIKDIAIKVTMENYPDTIQLGDVNDIRYENGCIISDNGSFSDNIDLVIFGSPCQSFSRCMKQDKRIGLEDKERSGLFLECYRVLQEVNPKYFLIENVKMSKENQDILSEKLGVQPIRINSSLVSAQKRDRLYWTNIPNVTIPEDKGIKLKDVINDGYVPNEKARCLLRNESHGYYNGENKKTMAKRFHRFHLGFGNIVFPSKEYYDNCVKIAEKICDGRPTRASYYNDYVGNDFDDMRYLWKDERARLQNVPGNYVDCLTEQEAADVLGDGWTVDVVAHIFGFMSFQ